MSSSSERKIGRYQVKKKLGEGAMAIVVLAYDPVFKRDVALKVLHRRLARNDEIRKRFLREARAIAQIDHPAIVPIYDAGQDGNFVYYVMRMMEGETLFDRVSQRAQTVEEVIPVMERITSALDAAHDNGFIHRDVKPENILFDRYNAAYLADFGILKQSDADANLTQNKLLGTPAYMSPEQVRGEDVTARSDIYSLGAVLFEMFTGELPFEADTAMSMAMKHITEPVPRLRKRNARLPKQVDQIVAKAMAKAPDDRFESGAELLASLRSVARPSTRTTATGDTLSPASGSRQRLWIGLVGLLLLASLAWGAFSIFGGDDQPVEELTPDAAAIAELTATAQYFAEQSDLLYTQEAIYLEETVTAVYEAALADAGDGVSGVETAVAATLAALQLTDETAVITGITPSATPEPTETAAAEASETPPPTDEPTEQPTEAPTEVAADIASPPMLIVRTSSANARRGPGTTYAVVTVVLADERYEVIGRNNGRDWYEVVLKNGQVGWIAASAALVDPEAADVPLGNVPPVPTSTRVAVQTATPNYAATQTRVADQTRAAGQSQVQATQTRASQVDNFNATQTAQANATRQTATRAAQAQATNVAGTATAAANAASWQATQTAQARPTATPTRVPPTATPVPPTAAPATATSVLPTRVPTKESTGPLELFFSYGSCRYEGIDYLCDLSLTAKGGSGGPYTIEVFDAEPAKAYTTSGTVVHVFRARRCSPWIHEVRVLDTQTNETISQNLFFDPNAHSGFPDGKCTEPE